MKSISAGLALVLVICMEVSFADKKPIWAIYHMTNDEAAVADGIKLGANAFETDMHFDQVTAMPSIVRHGGAGCFRDSHTCKGDDYCGKQAPAIPHLQHLGNMSTPGHKDYEPLFSGFVWLDLKPDGKIGHDNEFISSVGKNLADVLVDYIYETRNHDNASRLKIGLELYRALGLPEALADQLKKRQREDILQNIVTMGPLGHHPVQGKKIAGFWAESGCKDCNNSCGINLAKAKKAASLRDNANHQVDKVVRWTIDVTEHIRESLRAGVDGFCTNHPERVSSILKEDEFKESFRLATSEDKIWTKV